VWTHCSVSSLSVASQSGSANCPRFSALEVIILTVRRVYYPEIVARKVRWADNALKLSEATTRRLTCYVEFKPVDLKERSTKNTNVWKEEKR
jgi:hypothetical protein